MHFRREYSGGTHVAGNAGALVLPSSSMHLWWLGVAGAGCGKAPRDSRRPPPHCPFVRSCSTLAFGIHFYKRFQVVRSRMRSDVDVDEFRDNRLARMPWLIMALSCPAQTTSILFGMNSPWFVRHERIRATTP